MKDLVSYVDKKTSAIRNTAKKASDTTHFTSEEISDFYKKLIQETYELINSIKSEALDSVPVREKSKRIDDIKSIHNSYAEQAGNITHIHLDTLPPLRSKVVTNEGSINSLLFVAPIQNAIKNVDVAIHLEKSVLCFIYTIESSTPYIDHDNYFIKPIIDGIKVMLLPDDSSKYVSLYMNTIAGNKNCTDIYIVPEKEFASFIASQESSKTSA